MKIKSNLTEELKIDKEISNIKERIKEIDVYNKLKEDFKNSGDTKKVDLISIKASTLTPKNILEAKISILESKIDNIYNKDLYKKINLKI